MSNQASNYPKVSITNVLREYFRVAKPFWLTFLVVAISANIPVIAGGIIVPIYYKNFFDILTVKADVSILVSELIHTIFLILIMNFIGWSGHRLFQISITHLQKEYYESITSKFIWISDWSFIFIFYKFIQWFFGSKNQPFYEIFRKDDGSFFRQK